MKKAEIILAVLAVIALGFNLNRVPGASALTVLTLSSLSVFYMYLGFALFNGVRLRAIFKKGSFTEISKARTFVAIAAGIALSVTLVGIMFRPSIKNWTFWTRDRNSCRTGQIFQKQITLLYPNIQKGHYHRWIWINSNTQPKYHVD
jgi:hypothetical protein